MLAKIIIGIIVLILSISLVVIGKNKADEVDVILGILCTIGTVIYWIGIITAS